MNAMMIGGVTVRRDDVGRFCLNDLHQASGGAKRHQPSDWQRLKQTEELVAELVNSGDSRIYPVHSVAGRYGGSYVVRELVYAYAMWISPSFSLQVIRAYDALAAGAAAPDPMQALTDPATLRALLLSYSEKAEILEARVQYQEPQVRALLRLTQADGAFNISTAAKMLQVQPRQLFAWLSEHGWIYRRAGSKNWLAYQNRLQQGVLMHKACIQRTDGEQERVHEQVLVTAKGLSRLAESIDRGQMTWAQSDAATGLQLAAEVVQ